MSGVNINKEFTDFGTRMIAIAILTLLSMIFGILGIFTFVFTIISWVFDIVLIILFLLILGNTKRAGRELNNKELLDFKPKFFWGTVIWFIGRAMGNIAFWTYIWIFLIIGIVLIIVGSILRFKAWSGLAIFFDANVQLFTQDISGKANTGAKLCKIATIFDMTVILSFVGEILRIIGYFMLSVTRGMEKTPGQPAYQAPAAQPAPAPTPAPSTSGPNFCPNCGSSVTSGARFCPNCGSDIS